MPKPLAKPDGHFAFGDNWMSFAQQVSDEDVGHAEAALTRLFPDGELRGARVLDIGCGSGLSMLAAARLGAAELHGIDLDPTSVAAANNLLGERHSGEVQLEVKSVFDLDPAAGGTYDIVYSWGVLHHTGDMWRAVETASRLVRPDGCIAVALYRRTPLCPLWTVEKRVYSRLPGAAQALARAMYKSAYLAGIAATGRNPAKYMADYHHRGMDWSHDVHDWLGGYPYESTTSQEVVSFMAGRGFSLMRQWERPARALGLFGTHCDEYVFRRNA